MIGKLMLILSLAAVLAGEIPDVVMGFGFVEEDASLLQHSGARVRGDKMMSASSDRDRTPVVSGSLADVCEPGHTILAEIDVVAEPGDPLSFAFAGSAFLLPYYFGVMAILKDKGLVNPDSTQFGGISGGFLTSMLTCAGLTPDQLFQHFEKMRATCYNDERHCFRNLNYVAKALVYDKVLNEDVALRCGKGRVRVGYTALDPTADSFDGKVSASQDVFSSPGDIEEAMLASSYISCFSGPFTYVTFRGQPALDGGYAADFGDICPPNTQCVKVASYVVGPNTTESGASDPQDNICPPQTEAPDSPLPNWPRFDDPSWKLPLRCNFTYDRFQTPTDPDIFPGRFGQIRYSAKAWKNTAMCIPSLQTWEYILAQGREDAEAWYESVFVPARHAALRQLVQTYHTQLFGGHVRAPAMSETSMQGETAKARFTVSFAEEGHMNHFLLALRAERGLRGVSATSAACKVSA